jgi:single-stranded-DNA-specific exonuclease
MNFNAVLKKNWIFKKFDNNQVTKISEKFSLKEITSRLLAIRNINFEEIELFLNPSIKNTMPNPFSINDMENAVSRIVKSIDDKEIIAIFGDYDVDGAASTALLGKYFSEIKQNFITYIPDRKKDGYGPSINSFNDLIKKGPKVIITVDCGTSSYDAIEYAQSKGVDVIVLDHHQSLINLPIAHSIVNPNRLDDKSNLEYLCASGVCFMFLSGLNSTLRKNNWFNKNKAIEPNIINYLDLVCLGTICDVVPLSGLNRAIVAQGLKIIKKRKNVGLKTLYDLCKIESKPSTYQVGFMIGPRINAGGRVGKSHYGAELLMSSDNKHSYKIAKDLDNFNKERQHIENELLKKVEDEALNFQNDPILVLSGTDWHEGIIGIVASRIKDKYHKPTFLISLNKTEGKGSARSIYGFDLGSSIISAVQLGLLEKGGGHKMAGGFSIKVNKISEFKDFLIKRFNKIDLKEHKSNNLYLDAVLSASALNENFYNDIDLLSPFGPSNNEPTFVIEDIKIVNSTLIANKHIKTIMTSKNGLTIKGIAFNSKGSILEGYLSKNYKKKVHVAGKMTLNEYNGKKNIEFIIQDVATS